MEEQDRRTLQVFAGLTGIINAALDLFVRLAESSVQERGRFLVALSGGSTPAGLYSRLAEPPLVGRLPWERISLCFGDERCVAPDDPDSNFGMVKRTLLDRAPIPPGNVHRVRAELEPALAAEDYERDLSALFGLSSGALPRFDLILLGMGPDGHTASLFPHTDALGVRDRLVVANHVPQLQTDRITLTFPVINNARSVLFMVAGADKAEALQAVLESPADPQQFPSRAVQPTDGDLIWQVDCSAAARLRSQTG